MEGLPDFQLSLPQEDEREFANRHSTGLFIASTAFNSSADIRHALLGKGVAGFHKESICVSNEDDRSAPVRFVGEKTRHSGKLYLLKRVYLQSGKTPNGSNGYGERF